jgi:DNA ligase (NAD+)
MILLVSKRELITQLNRLYDRRNIINISDMVDMLNGMRINNLVNFLVYHEKEYDEEDSEVISVLIKILQYIYNNSSIECPISDELYDKLYAKLLSDGQMDIVGAEVSDSEIVHHQYPDLRGTLKKTHFFLNSEKGKNESRKSIMDWANSIENIIGRGMTEEEGQITIFPKFDGVSVIFECDKYGRVERALTRGFTEKNEASLIPILTGMRFTPNDEWRGSPFGIKTEIIMTYNNFKKFCKKYGEFKSPRSAVSSIINSKDIILDYLRYITIVPLRMQRFTTGEICIHPDAYKNFPNVIGNISTGEYICNLSNVFNNMRDYMDEAMGIPCDGVVLYMNNEHMRDILGRDDIVGINKFEVAYKFPPLTTRSHIIDVDFSIGLLGAITPVAKIEPVKMHGNTIKSVSLGSVDRFESLNLHYGDEVLIKYEIIPYLDRDTSCEESDGELIKIPTHCKYCGERLVNKPILKCDNVKCTCRTIGIIVNYLNKINILGISTSTVTTLFNMGILKSIEDLYKLKNHKNTIIESNGFGDKSYEKMIKAIKDRKKLKDYELLGAIGIPGIANKTFKHILFIYNIDELIDMCEENNIDKLTTVKGIASKSAEAIIKGIIDNGDLIDFLRRELTIINTKGVDSDVKILFSKVRDEDFEKFLSDKGIDIANGYNKNISLVIVPTLKAESGKITKAKKDGKEIITLSEAYKRFGYDSKG